MNTKLCNICDEEKDVALFARGNRCKACDMIRLETWRAEHPLFNWYHTLKLRAKRKGLEVLLTYQEFANWYDAQEREDGIPTCFYCGRQMPHTRKLNGVTIDRVDTTLGYTFSNMILCCRRCNIIKGNWFYADEMLEIADKYFKDEDKVLC